MSRSSADREDKQKIDRIFTESFQGQEPKSCVIRKERWTKIMHKDKSGCRLPKWGCLETCDF